MSITRIAGNAICFDKNVYGLEKVKRQQDKYVCDEGYFGETGVIKQDQESMKEDGTDYRANH